LLETPRSLSEYILTIIIIIILKLCVIAVGISGHKWPELVAEKQGLLMCLVRCLVIFYEKSIYVLQHFKVILIDWKSRITKITNDKLQPWALCQEFTVFQRTCVQKREC